MAVTLFDLTGVATGTTGTGSVTLGAALPGHSLFADAGVTDSDEVRYLIKDGSNRELGTGTYTASGTVLSRDTVHASIISGVRGTTKLTLSGAAEVYLVASSDDFGGGGLVPISATTASNDSAVDIALTGGYTKYRLFMESVRASSDSRQLWARFSDDDASTFDAGASDYAWAQSNIGSASTPNDAADNQIELSGSVIASSATALAMCSLDISMSDGTGMTIVSGLFGCKNVSGFPNGTTSIGYYNNTTRPTHIRILLSAGNLYGKFTLYGYADGA